MATSALSLPAERERADSPRLLGTLAMLASPMLLLSGVIYGFAEIPRNRVTAVLGLIFVLGWICSAVGLRLLRVTGTGAASKVLFLGQLTLLLLAASQQVQDLVFEHPEANGLIYFVADMAWPLSMLLMLVAGVFVLRAGVWRGWRRLPVFLCGLSLPVFIAASAVLGSRVVGGFLFGLLTTIGFMSLGYAIHTGRGTARAKSSEVSSKAA